MKVLHICELKFVSACGARFSYAYVISCHRANIQDMFSRFCNKIRKSLSGLLLKKISENIFRFRPWDLVVKLVRGDVMVSRRAG